MPASSARFEAILSPEPRLRKCVLLCGCLAMMTGILLILFMPLAAGWRILLTLAWSVESIRELRGQISGAARVQLLRLDAGGNIAGTRPDGRVELLVLLTGSLVLSRLAWLRVQFPDGRRYGELLRGDPSTDLEWQQLQLIWRHARAAFGRQDGS